MTSLFSIFHNVNRTVPELNRYLERIKLWASQCKMYFHAEKTEEIVFYAERNNPNYQVLKFGGNEVVKKMNTSTYG